MWREIHDFGRRAALLGSALLLVCLFWACAAARGNAPPPSVVITAPSAGSTVEGTVTIAATARAGEGDTPSSVTFYDGVNEIESYECEAQQPCTASIEWKATGLSGTHSLTARVETGEDQSVTSAPVVVTVVSPSPTVAITSPANGSTVKGTVAVAVSGATDPSQADYPTSIAVYDGVNEIDTVDCQGQQTCQGAVSWPATGLSGVHALTARIKTENGLSATSAPVDVTVRSPAPRVKITHPGGWEPLGGTLTVNVYGYTDPSQVDYPTSIVVFDGTNEIGGIDCQGQQSCGGSVRWNTHGLSGRHDLTAVIHTNAGRTATSARVVVGGPPPHSPTKPRAPSVKPAATASCRIASPTVALKHRDRGFCVVHGAPRGTDVAIQYRARGRWKTAAPGRVGRGGRFHFFLRGARPARYSLSILIAASSVSKATRIAIGTLSIR